MASSAAVQWKLLRLQGTKLLTPEDLIVVATKVTSSEHFCLLQLEVEADSQGLLAMRHCSARHAPGIYFQFL